MRRAYRFRRVKAPLLPFNAATKMMKHTLWIAGFLAVIGIGAIAQAADDTHQAQAGTRIGRVFIGDTKGAVGRRLGKPTRSFDLGEGLTSQLWRGKTTGDQGARNTLEVVFRGGIVSQIEVTSLIFKTPSNLSLASSRSQWERVYGKPVTTTYNYRQYGRKRYIDWKSKGIAVELLADEDETRANDGWIYQTLIVHKKGVPVVVDRGGTRE